jgi:hypothetical protein
LFIAVVGGTRKRKAKLGDMIKDATNNGRFLMGNAALTKLWNICPDNLVTIFLHFQMVMLVKDMPEMRGYERGVHFGAFSLRKGWERRKFPTAIFLSHFFLTISTFL